MISRAAIALVAAAATVACSATPREPARASAATTFTRAAAAVAQSMAIPDAAASSVAIKSILERDIDDAVDGAIARREVPGAVVVVARHGSVVLRQAYGRAAVEPAPAPMRVDTVFDLASLTKPLATALSVMKLVEAGRVRVDDAISKHLPELAGTEKESVTIEELLLHTSGLPADTPLAAWRGRREAAIARALATPLEAKPGERTRYSDIGFVILGALVERISGQRLDAYARAHVFTPLGLGDTTFLPRPELALRVAPTERRDGEMLRGSVHDPRAAALDGVAGHAGLFATADDVVKIGTTLVEGGAPILGRASVDAMLRPRPVPGGARALGGDVAPSLSSRRGATAVSHTGFTGTWLLVDPPSGVVAAVLTSRLHPNGRGDAKRLRTDVAAALRTWVADDGPARSVATGLDVLEQERFARLAGRRIGLVTNMAAMDEEGVGALRRFAEAREVHLVRVFTPEHGLEARAEGSVADARDAASGVPIVSLYGTHTRPKPEELADLDALVFDLPSVGARFYTYVTTLGLVLESAAAAKIPLHVLDRAPIGGAAAVEGPLHEEALRSLTGYARLPVRFGMTNGELARFLVATHHLATDLRVVAMPKYARGELGDEAPFRPPSPNLRSVDEALLYPGVALLERTNLSVGRGTETPFELVGAPWVDTGAWIAALGRERLRGVRITAATFVPRAEPFQGERCAGLAIRVTDRAALSPVELGLGLARALRASHPTAFRIDGVRAMLGNQRAFDALARGAPVTEIQATWRDDLATFLRARDAALLYRR